MTTLHIPLWFLFAVSCALYASAWSPSHPLRSLGPESLVARYSSTTSADLPATAESVDQIKASLVRACSSGDDTAVQREVATLIDVAERAGIGQVSSSSGLLSGDWELLYASEDDTRSSPFFWAFRKAVDEADQVYAITDAIPPPLKEVGPAKQEIDWNDTTQTGRLVSKVKVATLGGVATSIMTTRVAMVGVSGLDGVKLKIETTKPEKSTILSALGPVGEVISENTPAFPSGDALERLRPGSSEVVMQTPFCDEGLRISWNEERPNDVLVWKRTKFAEYEFL